MALHRASSTEMVHFENVSLEVLGKAMNFFFQKFSFFFNKLGTISGGGGLINILITFLKESFLHFGKEY